MAGKFIDSALGMLSNWFDSFARHDRENMMEIETSQRYELPEGIELEEFEKLEGGETARMSPDRFNLFLKPYI